jgi:hypothetical protein
MVPTTFADGFHRSRVLTCSVRLPTFSVARVDFLCPGAQVHHS